MKQTRKALEILTKGKVSYDDCSNGDMQGRAARFLEMFDERQRQIIAKQNVDATPLPFLESIKRKVAKIVAAPNTNMPVVTRYDLHTGIRKLSNRAPSDSGLKRLSMQLEKGWHTDPLGTLSYGEVSSLVGLYRDQYPRSKAADAIEAECTRVGMHKLPVAKLARIASKIASQEDYDVAIEANGYAGDRPEQVRARALVRELVAMRGSDVDAHQPKQKDTRDLSERLASRIEAQMLPEQPVDELEQPAIDMPIDMPADLNSPVEPDGDIQQTDIEQGADLVQEIDDMAQEIVQEAPPEAMDYIQHEMSEGHTAPPGTAEWGAEEILNEGHNAAPPTDEWLQEELAEMGMVDESPMMAPMKQAQLDEADYQHHFPDEANDGPAPELTVDDLAQMGITIEHGNAAGPNLHDSWDVSDGTRIYECINEQEAMEVAMSLAQGKLKTAAKGKGIPLPGDIDDQPNAKNALDSVPEDGGATLKAAEIEQAILDGKVVTASGVRLLVNGDMEVELWHKGAGRACDLLDLDVAISDFINIVTDERARAAAAKRAARSVSYINVVDVPCEVCASVTPFVVAASIDDEYACDCGHNISAGSVSALVDMGLLKVSKVAQKWRSDPKWKTRTEIGPLGQEEGRDLINEMDAQQPKIDFEPGDSGIAVSDIKDARGNIVIPAGTALRIDDIGAKDVTVTKSEDGDSEEAAPAPKAPATKNVSMPKVVTKTTAPKPTAPQATEPDVAAPAKDATPPKPTKAVKAPGAVTIPKSELVNVRKSDGGMLDLPEAGSFGNSLNKIKDQLDNSKVTSPGPKKTRQFDDMTARRAQAVPPPGGPLAAPAAPPAAAAPQQAAGAEQVITDMPMEEVISAAMTNYKAQGMNLPKAMRTFFKEHGDLVEQRWSDSDAGALVGMIEQYWTSAKPPNVSTPGVDTPAPAMAEAGGPMPMAAQKVLEPSIRKPKDHISVGKKPLGKDSQGEDLLPSPGKIKQQQGKPDGKLSDTNLGPDSSSKEWNEPSTAKSSPNKGKLPSTDMGEDSEGNDPFSVPGLNSKPSAKKKAAQKCKECDKEIKGYNADGLCADCMGK